MGRMLDAIRFAAATAAIMASQIGPEYYMGETRTFVKKEFPVMKGFTPCKGRKHMSKKKRKQFKHKLNK